MQVFLDAWLFSAFPSRASGSDKITPIHPLAEALEAMLYKCLSTIGFSPNFPSRASGSGIRGPQGKTFESLRERHSRASGSDLREPQGAKAMLYMFIDAWLFSAFPSRASGSDIREPQGAKAMLYNVYRRSLREPQGATRLLQIIRWLRHSKPCSTIFIDDWL